MPNLTASPAATAVAVRWSVRYTAAETTGVFGLKVWAREAQEALSVAGTMLDDLGIDWVCVDDPRAIRE